MSPSEIEVRGHSRFQRRASIFLLFFAGLVDFLIGALASWGIYRSENWDPALDWKLAPILAASVLLPWILARWALGSSLGERIWKTREGKTGIRENSDNLKAIFLTLVLLGGASYALQTFVLTHPYWSTGSPVSIEAQLPPSDWRVLSFFYTMAPWPVHVNGKPVFYSVPYEVGPPKRFLGHIESDWIKGSVRVSFEGPKTPIEFQSRVLNRSAVHECFLTSPWLAPACVETRRLVLERHLEELRGLGYAKFEVSWFSSGNTALPDEERAQGIRLRAHERSRIQDRYILITPQGLHQSISISYPPTPEGFNARDSFLVSLGTLRISEELTQGRAWTDRILQSTELGNLPPTSDPKYLENLAQIQALLISKISVDPGTFDPYYHLAGSSLLLLKYCMKHPDAELAGLAQAMVERMDRYAHDVAPHNPRMAELDRLLQDAKQF